MLTCFALMGGFFLTDGDGALLINATRIAEYRITDCGRNYSKEQCLEGYDGNARWSWKLPEAWRNQTPAAVLSLCAAQSTDPLANPQTLPEE